MAPIWRALAALAWSVLLAGLACAEAPSDPPRAPAEPQPASAPAEPWAWHVQLTNVTQGHRSFHADYSGANSLKSDGRTEETSDLTLYAGIRAWPGAELWINPEIDQGFGLSNTVGLAGFSSGEAYKVGMNQPYLRLHRLFLRQVIALGEATGRVDPAANQLGGQQADDKLTLTLGKLSVVDIFDINSYAHDPRGNFLNWSIIDAGAFDYAADPWGYTYGAAAEWDQGRVTLRGGVFQLSALPNAKITGIDGAQYMLVSEVEERHDWRGHGGKLKVLLFVNRARMARYEDAVRLGESRDAPPDPALVRRPGRRAGVVLNLEQELTRGVGSFARLSANDGSKETYEFTDISRSLALGISVGGARWGRAADTIGLGAAVNALSGAARDYFAAGGLGLLIGDGRLNYAPERIIEAYYSLGTTALGERLHAAVALDCQYIQHPAYNRDRGPVSIVGLRLHADF